MTTTHLRQDRSTRSQHTTRHPLVGLLFTLALSSLFSTSLAFAANDEVTTSRSIIEPGEEITVRWQTTLGGANYVSVYSLDAKRIFQVIPTLGKTDEVNEFVWSTAHEGNYRLELRHRNGFDKIYATSDTVEVISGRPSLRLDGSGEGPFKTHQPFRVKWVVRKDFVGSLKLAKGSQVPGDGPSVEIDAIKDGKPTGNGHFYVGTAFLTPTETGQFSLVLQDKRFESQKATVSLIVGPGPR